MAEKLMLALSVVACLEGLYSYQWPRALYWAGAVFINLGVIGMNRQ